MGHYADEKTRLTALLAEKQKQADLLDPARGNGTVVFKRSAADKGDHIYVQFADRHDSDATEYSYTGTGGIKSALAAWRTANSSATSGDMYVEWNYFTNTKDDAFWAGEKAKFESSASDIQDDIDHIQKIIDNGEDSANVDFS